MRLGFCSRSGDVIEPLLKPQWYVRCGDISKKMIEVVKTKELLILPEEFEKDWYRWLENIRDWCISRQIIWGHQCPVYLVTIEGSGKSPDGSNDGDWVAARNVEEAYERAAKKFNVDRSKIKLKQDDDVLDTWFSSGLFPFSPFNWPQEDNLNFKAFYPNTLLETGHDILFFWVARMVN
jgi:valyl-tRNA synthetase